MKYIDFLEKVRYYVYYYVSELERDRSKEVHDPRSDLYLKSCARSIAKVIKEFEANREPDSRDIHLCPWCNEIISKDGEPDVAAHPERVGQPLYFYQEIWHAYEGYKCALCNYDATHEIEHWE